MCISSFAPSLDAAYSEVPGFSAIEFQAISAPLVNPSVCELYQSLTVVVVKLETASPSELIMNVVFVLVVVDTPDDRVNVNTAPSPEVDIPVIALSTVTVLAPIATTVVPVEITELPPVTVTMSPNKTSVIIPAIPAVVPIPVMVISKALSI